MHKFTIIEFDNDYHSVTGHEIKEFEDLNAAEAYCKKESWRGESYFVDPEERRQWREKYGK